MVLLKEKNRQRAITMLVICLLLFMGLAVLINFLVYKNYCDHLNAAVSGMVSEIKKQYPLVQTEALVHVLNQERKDSSLKLCDFGIEADTVNVLKSMRQGYYYSMACFLPVIFCFGILTAGILFFYFSEENKKIGEITEYIHAIHKKNYDLCIQENEEGVISQLKNELYKITVMLKEQAENSRREKEAMRDSMADISHQIKTPMTSVLVLLDNVREHQDMPGEIRHKFLVEANKQLLWINSLVISLLKLSKLEVGVVEMKQEKIYLYEFFMEIKESLMILIETGNVKVSVEENRELYILGDRYWEREAMMNLLKNAVEHTLAGKEVRVSFDENYFYTGIMIEDQGEGMDEEDQGRIFERFYRGKYSSADGVGIGLSLAKKIIESDHGTVKVKSEKGKGTVFFMRYMLSKNQEKNG